MAPSQPSQRTCDERYGDGERREGIWSTASGAKAGKHASPPPLAFIPGGGMVRLVWLPSTKFVLPDATCRGAWARVTIDKFRHFRHSALQTF
jgi:hypothetical protein